MVYLCCLQTADMLHCMQVLILENVRFYKEETKNDPGFAEKVQICAD